VALIDLITGGPGNMGQHAMLAFWAVPTLLAYLVMYRDPETSPRGREIAAAVFYTTAGLAARSGWWWWWYLARARGWDGMADWLLEWSIVLVLPFGVTVFGYVLHLKPWLRRFFGRFWPPAAVLAAFLVYALGALPGLVGP
jgi:hypothetical protein